MTSAPTIPTPAADSIDVVTLRTTRAFWPVSFSVETAHEAVAVVKLDGVVGYFVASWDSRPGGINGGRWLLADDRPHDSVSSALAFVPAAVVLLDA